MKKQIQNTPAQFLLYKTSNEDIKLEVLLQDETIWLTQKQMSELFDKERSVITKHIKNIFKEGELEEKSNVQILHIANSDKPVKFYNLDIIISVGYRVRSIQGTRFLQWATARLKEYIIKGFTIMKDWVSKLNDYSVLKHQGKISHNVAVALAYKDFDKMIEPLEDKDD